MKKLILSLVLGLLLVPLISLGQSSLGPGVTGNSLTVPGLPHNFSSGANNAVLDWNPEVRDLGTNVYKSGAQICQPCHTPHNANTSVTKAPLWNHTLTSSNFTMYSGIKAGAGTMGAVIDGTSLLCLSCHDGSVALSAFGGSAAATPNTITGGALLGTDLSNDHPVGVAYDVALSSGWGGLQPLSYLYSNYTSPGVYTVGTRTVTARLDANLKVQCTSCHGAHANKNGYQLSMDNRGSALCLACHAK